MFPNKIKITDDIKKLIVDVRKEHNLTAYQLSESIGKNKSWIPNIENDRTKNITKEDLFKIFEDFAKEEGINTEKFIINHINSKAILTLHNGSEVKAIDLQLKDDLELLQNDSKKSSDNDNTYIKEVRYQKDTILLNCILEKIESIIYKDFNLMEDNDRKYTLRVLECIRQNIEFDFFYSSLAYNTLFFDNIPTNLEECESGKKFINEFTSICIKFTDEVRMINAKVKVYCYFDNTNAPFSISHRLLEQDFLDYDTLSEILIDIEKYMNEAFQYIKIAYEFNSKYGHNQIIEYRKLYSLMDRFLCAFVHVSKINYKYIFSLPKNDFSYEDIQKKQLEINNILFEIRQSFYSKYSRLNTDKNF